MRKILFLLSFLCLISCLNNQTKDDEAENLDFGASYAMVQTTDLPSISNDSLFVKIDYSGCHDAHNFELRNKLSDSSTAKLWLFKLTPDQSCDAYFQETKVFPLSTKVLQSSEIFIFAPFNTRIKLTE